MKKLISIIITLLVIGTDVLYAANPFDILHVDTPDLAVNNIWQDKTSWNLYIKVCNIGWSMEEDGKISVWMQRASWSTKNKYVELNWVRFTSNECKDYWIGKPSDISILTNWRYYLAWWVRIDYFKQERVLSNNIFKKYVDIDISYWKDFNTGTDYTYYNNNYNYYNNNYYVDYPYYWTNNTLTTTYYYNRPDLKIQNIEYYKETTVYDNWISRVINNAVMLEVCNAWNSFTSNSSISAYVYWDVTSRYINLWWDWRNWPENQCRKVWINANNLWINRDWNFTISAKVDDKNVVEERDENNNTYSESVYFNYYNNCYWNNCVNTNNNNRTYYCNWSWQYTSNQSWYYCNWTWYNWNDSNSGRNNNSKIDLSVQSVKTTWSDRRIYAQVCNVGRSLSSWVRIDLYFYVNWTTKNLRKYITLNSSECTDVGNYIYYEDLGLSRWNYYNINVRLNTNDYTDENTSNNTIDRSLYTE